jgi:putative MFS transporter
MLNTYDIENPNHELRVGDVVARLERIPIATWHVKTRIIVGIVTFFDAFDALAIAFVLPVLVPLWHLSPQKIGFLISAGYLGQLAGALLFGWLAQRVGRVRALVWSVMLFAAMGLCCGLFAWNYQSLLILRAIQGLGLGGEVPIAAVYISEITKASGRGRFILLYELVFPVGLVAAGFVGRWIVPNLGWHSMFLADAIPAIFALFLQRALPESPRWLAVKGRSAEAEKSLIIIEKATEKAIGYSLPPPLATATVVESAASWRDLFGKLYLRRTLVVWTIWFSAYLITYGLTVWLPTIYRSVFKLSLEQSLQYGLLTQICGLLGTILCALTIDRVGRRPWFAFACAGAAVTLCLLWYIGADSASRLVIFVSIAFFFSSILSIGVYLYTPELYPTRSRALGVATATAWLRVASIIGPTAMGVMIANGNFDSGFLLIGLVAGAASVVTLFFATETKGGVLEDISP